VGVGTLGANELNISRCIDVATGAMIGWAVLMEMIWRSTLETPEGIPSVEIARTVCRKDTMSRGRWDIRDGCLRREGDVSRGRRNDS